jgi:integrase/recombinase XerD
MTYSNAPTTVDYVPDEEIPLEESTSEELSEPSPAAMALSPTTSLAAALAAWIESRKKAGLSANTIKNYGLDIQLLSEYVGGGVAVGQFTTQILNNYLDWMRNQRGVPCSNKTLDRRITSLKSFFRWLSPAADLVVDPAQAVVNVSVRSPLPIILTDTEIEHALAAAKKLRLAEKKPDIRPATLFTFLIHTCLRKGETARLVINHLDLSDDAQPHLYVRYADKRHRHKERKVSLDPTWVATYHEYAAKYKIEQRVFPWSVRRLEYLLEDITNAAGLKKHISFDMLRWTCAVSDYRSGMEPERLRRKMGLSKVQWGEVRRKIIKLTD